MTENKRKFSWKIWKSMILQAKSYWKAFCLLAGYMVILAGADTVFPLMSRYAIDNFVVKGTTEGMGTFGLVYLAIVLVQVAVVWFFIELAGKINTHFGYDLRKRAFDKLQELSLSYYDRTSTGWIMSRLTSDVKKIGDILAWGTVDLVWGVFMMAAIAVVMLVLNWKLALVALSVVPLLFLISIFFQRRILASYRTVRKVNSKITAAFNEGIMGAKTTKTLVREGENLREFEVMTGEMYGSSVRASVFSALYLPSVLFLGSVGTALALWHGGDSVALGGVTYGTLVAFISYTVQFFEPVLHLARIVAEIQNGTAAAERVISLIDEEPEINEDASQGDYTGIRGDIEFKNVTFAYKDGEKVLDNFSLKVKRGEKIALVGETGSGKSTIVNLALRFYEPCDGEVRIDGIDYRKRPLAWIHADLGYVLQSPHLFSGTVMENIRYGRLDATDEEVIEAAKLVDAHEFIQGFENGYQTEVGEGGNRLSTGQKQLVSFARALLADPAIFVLDEATSSVDTETEAKIERAVGTILEGRTSFIIAHRLSTVKSADRILVLRQGIVEEEGSHDVLLEKGGYYAKLYRNQFVERISA